MLIMKSRAAPLCAAPTGGVPLDFDQGSARCDECLVVIGLRSNFQD